MNVAEVYNVLAQEYPRWLLIETFQELYSVRHLIKKGQELDDNVLWRAHYIAELGLVNFSVLEGPTDRTLYIWITDKGIEFLQFMEELEEL